jgi:hypothetical protein
VIDLDTDIRTALEGRQGQLVVKRTQDTTPYLEANQRELNSHGDWRPYSGKGTLRKIAEIPNIVAEKWLREEGLNILSGDPGMMRKLRRKLDDIENKKLRTMPGRVGQRTRHI